MENDKIAEQIALLERKLKSEKNETLKKALTKKVERLKNDLEGAKLSALQLASKLLKAKNKVKELKASDFNELIRRLSKKPEYYFLKGMSKQEIKDDLAIPAKPVGWRFKGRGNYKTPTKKQVIEGKANGTVYYENRPERSDVSRVAQLEKGGDIGNTIRIDKDMPFMASLSNLYNKDLKVIDVKDVFFSTGNQKYFTVEVDGDQYEVPERFTEQKMATGGGVEDLIRLGSKIKKSNKKGGITQTTKGTVYEIKADKFKLVDDYGNKSDKWHYISEFSASDVKNRKMETGGGVGKDYKIQNFLDIIRIADNSIKLEDITVDATPKGNWTVYHKGNSLTTVKGNLLDEETIDKYDLKHYDKYAKGGIADCGCKYENGGKIGELVNIEDNNSLMKGKSGIVLMDLGKGNCLVKVLHKGNERNVVVRKSCLKVISDKFEKGGDVNSENAEMVMNNNKQIEHHTEELIKAVRNAKEVPAWVVAKVSRAASDLSDATHYLDGESKMQKGGGVSNPLNEVESKKYTLITKEWGDIHIIPTSNNFYDEIKNVLKNSGVNFTSEIYDSGTEYFKIKNNDKMAKGGGVEEPTKYEIINSNVNKESLNNIFDAIKLVNKNGLDLKIVDNTGHYAGGYNHINSVYVYSLINFSTLIRKFNDILTSNNIYYIHIKEILEKGSTIEAGGVESKINELYKKSKFINDDFNWKLKLLEMLQDNSIDAYNIYQTLTKEQKEQVLQEQYEVDNDMGSDGDGKIKTTKENIRILLSDAKNGKKYAKGSTVKVEKVMQEFKEGKLHSSSKKGPIVKNPKQAIAIALNQAGLSKKGWNHNKK